VAGHPGQVAVGDVFVLFAAACGVEHGHDGLASAEFRPSDSQAITDCRKRV
jgi:hypothetical protein